MDNGYFSPATLRVPVGSTITFINNDIKPHKITSNKKVIETIVIDPKSSYIFTNDFAAGTFSYYCAEDTAIRGTIIFTTR